MPFDTRVFRLFCMASGIIFQSSDFAAQSVLLFRRPGHTSRHGSNGPIYRCRHVTADHATEHVMRTAYCPTSHTELASTSAGIPYGHVPGHHYSDVDCVVSERGGKYRCHVVQSWGSAQGYDQEHGRREAIGRGDGIADAVRDARRRAKDAGIVCDYLEAALSKAEDDAEECLANAE